MSIVASRNSSLGGQRAQEAGVGGQPEDGGLVERGDQRAAGALPVGAVDDHLAEHRVVRRADTTCPGSSAWSTRTPSAATGTMRRRAGLGQEAAEGVLGVDPRLDGVAVDRHVVLGDRQRLAGRDPELELDQVECRRDAAR